MELGKINTKLFYNNFITFFTRNKIDLNLKKNFLLIKTMSWFNRLTSNVLSGARRLASNITDSVRRRVTDFGNWLTSYVGPEQTSQV